VNKAAAALWALELNFDVTISIGGFLIVVLRRFHKLFDASHAEIVAAFGWTH
jgi:hypothetical protein